MRSSARVTVMTPIRGTATSGRVLFVGAVAFLAACIVPRDRAAEAPHNRPMPGYRNVRVSPLSSDTVPVRYTVDSLGRVDSSSIEMPRSAPYRLTVAVRASLIRTVFRPARHGGRPTASQREERFVFHNDSTMVPVLLIALRDTSGSVPSTILGSASSAPGGVHLAWADVGKAYEAVLDRLLQTPTLSDSLRGRDAPVCLGTPFPPGEDTLDNDALAFMKARGRDAVMISDCRPASGIIRVGAPPPRFTPPPGRPVPVYIDPAVESWTTDAVWIRSNVVQHHGVDVLLCEAERREGTWTASCRYVMGYVF
jgi:hypothetical protein